MILTVVYLTLTVRVISSEECSLKLKEKSLHFPFTEIDGDVVIDKNCFNYHIYTQKNKFNFDLVSEPYELNKTDFDPSKFTLIFVHGYFDKGNGLMTMEIKKILNDNDINLIIVDWSKYSFIKYNIIRPYVKNIGEIIGEFINETQKIYDLSGSEFLLTGHSTGAHIAGNANNILQNKIKRIIGLDPAGPLFNKPTEDRLSTSHANLVEIIHTASGRFGIIDSLGHKNFYVNGGIAQKGCPHDLSPLTTLIGLCDHIRVITYFVESLSNGPKFKGIKCDSYQSYLLGKCNNNPRSIMGGLHINNEKIIEGNYYLETGDKPPYAVIGEKYKQMSVKDKLELYEFEQKSYGTVSKSQLDPQLLNGDSIFNLLF